jgi:hypothetical protein
MTKARPCSVCGEMTPRFLFNDETLDVAICSGRCEHQYIQTSDSKQEAVMLRYLDDKIEKTKRDEKIGWTTAVVGLLLVAVGFFVKNVDVFLFGVLPMAGGALSTRHFEDRREKLTRTRKRIAI